jgi:hypothetical protein
VATLASYLKHTIYAENYLAGGKAMVSFAVGMTPRGFLAALVYNALADDVCIVWWPFRPLVDKPYTVGVVATGGNLRLYLNGSNDAWASSTSLGIPVAAPLDLTVGTGDHVAIGGVWFGPRSGANTANAHWLNVADVAVWDRAVSRPDMYYLYAGGSEWVSYDYQRITRVLDFAGWPATWRSGLDKSTWQLLATPAWEPGANAAELVTRAATSVGGLVFIAADGTLTYQRPSDRNYHGIPAQIFTDADGTSIDDTFAYDIDDNDICNRVEGTTRSGLSFEYFDQTSIDTYGERSQSVDSDLRDARDAVSAAAALVNRFKAPLLRCPTVTVDVSATPDSIVTDGIFGLELGMPIGLDDLPSTAPGAAMTVVIESIAWQIDAQTGDWKVTFEVSPGQLYSHLLLGTDVLDTATLGDP